MLTNDMPLQISFADCPIGILSPAFVLGIIVKIGILSKRNK